MTRERRSRRTAIHAASLWALGCCTMLIGLSAFAQQSTNPIRVDERLRPRQDLPSLDTPLVIPAPSDKDVSDEIDQIRFLIQRVVFEGRASLPEIRLQEIADDYTGREVSLGAVYALADRVTAAYRDQGYILARAVVPAQQIDDDVLRIRIIEGFIDKITIEGDAGGAARHLRKQAERIKETRPLTAEALERQLLLAGDMAGLVVRSVLRPSETTPEAADLTLVVERNRTDGQFVAVDNYSNQFFGREEVIAGGYLNDVLGTGGRLGLTGVASPERDPRLAYGAVSFEQPLSASGLSLFASFSYSRTRPGLALENLDTEGRAQTARLATSYPLIRSRDLNVIASLGFFAGDIESENAFLSPIFDDSIRNVNLGVFVNMLDRWGGRNTVEVTFTQGLTVLNASENGDDGLSRTGAGSDYRRFNIEATRLQPLVSNLALQVRVAGQTSFGEALLASEEIGFGGPVYGRGFDPAAITGDNGLAGSAELQWNAAPGLPFLQSVQYYGFYDAGTVEQMDVLPGERERETIVSAGLGVRAGLLDRVHVDLYAVKPVRQDLNFEISESVRAFFYVSASF